MNLLLASIVFTVFTLATGSPEDTLPAMASSPEVVTATRQPLVKPHCVNATLQNVTTFAKPHCCWCVSDTAVKCVLSDNLGMNATLYTMQLLKYDAFLDSLTFLLNNSWHGLYPVIKQYDLDLHRLQSFSELRRLRIVPSRYQTEFVPLKLTEETFKGCNKLEELRINIPLNDTKALQWILAPLVNLTTLDFNNVRGVSYRNMNASINYLTRVFARCI